MVSCWARSPRPCARDVPNPQRSTAHGDRPQHAAQVTGTLTPSLLPMPAELLRIIERHTRQRGVPGAIWNPHTAQHACFINTIIRAGSSFDRTPTRTTPRPRPPLHLPAPLGDASHRQGGQRPRPPRRTRAAPVRCGMSERTPRGAVPARVDKNNRVAFYPSGLAGVGSRRYHRASSAVEAESFADGIISLGRGGRPLETHYTEPAFMAMKAFLTHLQNTGQPRGTWAQYRSNWNCWMPKEVALARCCDLYELHWASVFTAAVENGASVGTLSAITRTLGALMTFGMHHGYFQSEPFGPTRMRRDVVRAAKQAAIGRDGDNATGITIDLCPHADEISEYADALEMVYPGYGRRLVLLAFRCGARIMELAALRDDDLDPDQLTVAIGAQLDRNRPWPATRLPKNHKPRVADLWGIGEDNARSLIADARNRPGPHAGWLFPPLPGVTNWADKLSHLATDAARACSWKDTWTFHWTRHSYAAYSLAPTTRGGYCLCMWCRHPSGMPTPPPPNAPTSRSSPATPTSCGCSPPGP